MNVQPRIEHESLGREEDPKLRNAKEKENHHIFDLDPAKTRDISSESGFDATQVSALSVAFMCLYEAKFSQDFLAKYHIFGRY